MITVGDDNSISRLHNASHRQASFLAWHLSKGPLHRFTIHGFSFSGVNPHAACLPYHNICHIPFLLPFPPAPPYHRFTLITDPPQKKLPYTPVSPL